MASQANSSDSRGVKRKHRSISIKEKVELLKKLDSGVSMRKLCDDHGIGSSTVYDIKKQREKILKFYAESDSTKQMSIRKTMKDGKSTEHDRVMMEWFRQRRSDGVDLSGTLIMNQAKLFHTELKLEHTCDYSEGWLQRFKKRHGISMKKVCGEKRSADHEGAAAYVDEFAKLIAEEGLSPEQVYNADETALYWRCTPRKTLATEDEEELSGFKQSKDRLTILGCSNAAGTHKCKPLVIGKSKCPRALKGVKILPVTYRANKTGWITTEIALEWFEKFFVPEAKAHCKSVGLPEDCKILLILDNCSAHPKAELLTKKNVYTVYLPPNCTSLIQPQDQGILRSLKAKYRSLFMKRMLDVVNAGKPVTTFIKELNMKDVVWFIARGWNMVEPSTLKKGWHKLWPALMFANTPGENVENNFTGFNVPKEKEVRELLEYAKSVTGPVAEEVVSSLNETNLAEWMNVDDEAPVVNHLTDSEIIDSVLNADRPKTPGSDEDNSDEDDTNVAERVSIDKLIDLISEGIKGLEQRSFISEQELMNQYLLREKLYKERSKHMKQLRLDDIFKKVAKKSVHENSRPTGTLENPVASTSSAPDIQPATSETTGEVISYETDSNPDSPQLPDLRD